METIEFEDLRHFFLDGAHLRECEVGFGMCTFAFRIEQCDLLDIGQLIEHFFGGEHETFLPEPVPGEPCQQKRQHTVEGMNLDLLVGPMAHGLPSQEAGLFHLPESMFDFVLAMVGPDNCFIGPVRSVGDQDGLAEVALCDLPDHLRIGGEVESGQALFLVDGDIEDILHMLGFEYVLDTLADGCDGWPPSPLLSAIMPGKKFFGEREEPVRTLGDGRCEIRQLPGIEPLGELHHHRALPTVEYPGGPIGFHPGQVGRGDSIVGWRDREELLVMSRCQGCHEGELLPLDPLEIVTTDVTLIEDDRDLIGGGVQGFIHRGQSVGETLEDCAVMEVSLIDIVHHRDVTLIGDQEGQTDLPEVIALRFVLAPLGQPATLVEGVNEGKEVSGVIQQVFGGDLKGGNCLLDDLLLDTVDLADVDGIHGIPEALGGEGRGGMLKDPLEDRLPVPWPDLHLAPGIDCPVDGRQGDELPDTGPLIPLGEVVIDDIGEVQHLGNTIEGGRGTELKDDRLFGLGRLRLISSPYDRFDGAEILLPDDTRLAVDPC